MICFVVHFYKDTHLAIRLIKQIRLFYQPVNADLIVLGDGIHDETIEALASDLNFHYFTSPRLKTWDRGAQWTERYLQMYLDLSQKGMLIKLDPDASMARFFNHFPVTDWFGTINTHWTYPFVRGGCVGYWRGAVKRILDSGLLVNSKFICNPEYAYRRFLDHRWEGELINHEWIGLQDRMMAYIADQMHLSSTDWTEVDIQYRDYIPRNFDNRYAVVHPVPF